MAFGWQQSSVDLSTMLGGLGTLNLPILTIQDNFACIFDSDTNLHLIDNYGPSTTDILTIQALTNVMISNNNLIYYVKGGKLYYNNTSKSPNFTQVGTDMDYNDIGDATIDQENATTATIGVFVVGNTNIYAVVDGGARRLVSISSGAFDGATFAISSGSITDTITSLHIVPKLGGTSYYMIAMTANFLYVFTLFYALNGGDLDWTASLIFVRNIPNNVVWNNVRKVRMVSTNTTDQVVVLIPRNTKYAYCFGQLPSRGEPQIDYTIFLKASFFTYNNGDPLVDFDTGNYVNASPSAPVGEIIQAVSSKNGDVFSIVLVEDDGQQYICYICTSKNFYNAMENYILDNGISTPAVFVKEKFVGTQNEILSLGFQTGIGDAFEGAIAYDVVKGTYNGTLLPCLLKGTLVKTPSGWKPIETIREGDKVVAHNRKIVTVIKAGSWDNTYDGAERAAWVYKVPAGKMKTNTDLFISCYHRFVLPDGSTKIARQMGYPRATKEEISDNYTLYHLRLEDPENNHLLVNGGCVVECWH